MTDLLRDAFFELNVVFMVESMRIFQKLAGMQTSADVGCLSGKTVAPFLVDYDWALWNCRCYNRQRGGLPEEGGVTSARGTQRGQGTPPSRPKRQGEALVFWETSG